MKQVLFTWFAGLVVMLSRMGPEERANPSRVFFWILFLTLVVIGGWGVILILTLLHELGHWVVGRYVGLTGVELCAGPFSWRRGRGLGRRTLRTVPALGYVVMGQPSVDGMVERYRKMIIAGPVASAVGSLCLALGCSFAATPFREMAWGFALYWTLMSFYPYKKGMLISDSAYLRLPDDEFQRYCATAAIFAEALSFVRPRAYDPAMLEVAVRAGEGTEGEWYGLQMRAASLGDARRFEEAVTALRRAGEIAPPSMRPLSQWVLAAAEAEAGAPGVLPTAFQPRDPTQTYLRNLTLALRGEAPAADARRALEALKERSGLWMPFEEDRIARLEI